MHKCKSQMLALYCRWMQRHIKELLGEYPLCKVTANGHSFMTLWYQYIVYLLWSCQPYETGLQFNGTQDGHHAVWQEAGKLPADVDLALIHHNDHRDPQGGGQPQSSVVKGEIAILKDERGDWNPQRWEGKLQSSEREGRLQSSEMRGEIAILGYERWKGVTQKWVVSGDTLILWDERPTVILRGLGRRQYGASLYLQWLGETTVYLTNLACRHKLAWNPHELTNCTDWYKDKMEVYSLQR